MKSESEKITIDSDEDLELLVRQFQDGSAFAGAFVFENNVLYKRFFDSVGIDINEFQKKYYYFNQEKKIHISESENGYLWISTIGLVAESRITDDNFINACSCQKIVLMHLLNDAIDLCNAETSYDVNGYNYSMIKMLTPALLHNIVFYFELLAKAYLSVSGDRVPHTHKLENLLQHIKETMYRKHQNDSIFHAYVIPMFEETVRHIAAIPGSFKEEYVKYDDNPQDTTIILFDANELRNLRDLVEISCEIVTEIYYDPKNAFYLGTDLYARLLEKCSTDEDKKRIERTYDFLLK